MGYWTSLVVLAVAAASTLSFPRPDAAYNIPTVGLGSRSQYYVLHSDGSYKYGYDTVDGPYEQAMAKIPGHLSGEFGYKDPTGKDIKLEYTADNRGFIAKGSHLPVAPEVPTVEGVQTPAVSPFSPSVYMAPVPQPAVVEVPSVYEVAQVKSSSADDGSYSFSYKTSDSSRSESGDTNNAVSGTYSFIADDGIDRQIQYQAGAATGYIVSGDFLPVGPPVPGAESGIPTGHIVPVISEEEANALAGTTYTASDVAEPSVVVYSADETPSDASYSFSYDAGESARSESADSNLNIKGSYSFIPAGESRKLTVNYIAGPETGFVAEGDHLPKAEDVDLSAKVTETHEYVSPTHDNVAPVATPEVVGPAQTYSAADDSSSDASYSFSYDAEHSSRSESSDSNLNVEGSFSFLPPDSSDRLSVTYVAGPKTGFVAYGDHLPVAPEIPVVPEVSVAQESVAPAIPDAPLVYKAPEVGVPHTVETAAAQVDDQPVGYSSQVIGNVLLHQYTVEYPDKYGYVFTAV